MKVTQEGLDLIKQHEGFRGTAYRDAVGVWTIGYGHTSMAGKPEVTPKLIISRAAAEEILRRDVEKFASGVAELVRVDLGDQQYSALVSFAYNVGLGNFKSSSVLTAVNRSDFEAVPRRLGLWTKAGGKVLPGLVKRRAAEGAMFVSQARSADPAAPLDIPAGKPSLHSKTIWSAACAALLSLLQFWVFATLKLSIILILGGLLIALGIIVYERLKKSKEESL